eukprot:4327906-Pyramimonas_sp.AAC.1
MRELLGDLEPAIVIEYYDGNGNVMATIPYVAVTSGGHSSRPTARSNSGPPRTTLSSEKNPFEHLGYEGGRSH